MQGRNVEPTTVLTWVIALHIAHRMDFKNVLSAAKISSHLPLPLLLHNVGTMTAPRSRIASHIAHLMGFKNVLGAAKTSSPLPPRLLPPPLLFLSVETTTVPRSRIVFQIAHPLGSKSALDAARVSSHLPKPQLLPPPQPRQPQPRPQLLLNNVGTTMVLICRIVCRIAHLLGFKNVLVVAKASSQPKLSNLFCKS